MDKSESFSGNGGPLFAETRSALYDLEKRPQLVDVVYGLGGRDFRVEDAKSVYIRLQKIAETGETGPVYSHLGVRREGETK